MVDRRAAMLSSQRECEHDQRRGRSQGDDQQWAPAGATDDCTGAEPAESGPEGARLRFRPGIMKLMILVRGR
jgi:hypothetical protein